MPQTDIGQTSPQASMALDISTRSARQDPKAIPIAAASGVPKKPAEPKLNRRKTTRREEKKKRRKEVFK